MKGYQSFSAHCSIPQGQFDVCCVRERKVENESDGAQEALFS
jgi:hypothetical protein